MVALCMLGVVVVEGVAVDEVAGCWGLWYGAALPVIHSEHVKVGQIRG